MFVDGGLVKDVFGMYWNVEVLRAFEVANANATASKISGRGLVIDKICESGSGTT